MSCFFNAERDSEASGESEGTTEGRDAGSAKKQITKVSCFFNALLYVIVLSYNETSKLENGGFKYAIF